MALTKNTITSFSDSVVHNSMKGDQFEGVWRGGIYKGFGHSINQLDKAFVLHPGFGSIYGREFEITEAMDIGYGALTGIKYCVVYVEINLQNITNHKAEVKMAYAGAGFPSIESDDLIRNANGIARMPLYRFTIASQVISNVTKIAYEYEPGTAEHVRLMEGTGKLNSREINKILHYQADRWKNADRAVYVDVAKKLGGTEEGSHRVDNTLKLIDDNAALVQISKGEFRIQGTQSFGDAKDQGPVLNENGTYKFYYTAGDKLPSSLKVIGLLVVGTFRYSRYSLGFLGIGSGWSAWNNRQHFANKVNVKVETGGNWCVNSAIGDDKMSIFGGDLWHNSRPLYMHRFYDVGGGSTAQGIGVIISTLSTSSYGSKLATLTFKDVNTNDPYIEVSVEDDIRIGVDLSFRLIFTEGTISRNKTDSNKFAGVTPAIVM